MNYLLLIALSIVPLLVVSMSIFRLRSQIKHQEEQIKLLNELLELRVQERTRELRYKNVELAKQQQIVVNASKMSALGEMAGGIAHEINNPLSVIQMRSEILRDAAESKSLDASTVIQAVDVILKTTQRIAKIVKGLRSFARDGKDDPFAPVSAQAVIDESLDLCREKFKSAGIPVTVNAPAEPIIMECRSIQISQILINLLHNAFDAMQSYPEKWIKITLVDLGQQIELSVIDSGSGIPKSAADKIMQPFFTTKGVGKGTGLGLSISRGIAQAHNGQLLIDWESTNTRFVLLLPKVQERQQASAA